MVVSDPIFSFIFAIETGTVIYEVQEVSDITYRLYDWGRMGMDGKPRDLHVGQSLKVINYNDSEDHRTVPVTIEEKGFSRSVLVGCKYFILEKYDIRETAALSLNGCFSAVSVLSGEGSMAWAGGTDKLAQGDTVLVPACLNEYELKADAGRLETLVSYVPESVEKSVASLKAAGIADDRIAQLGGLV